MLRLKIVHQFVHVKQNVFVDEANHIYIAMPMYNLIEYSDNYSDTSGSLWQFKRDEIPAGNADLTINFVVNCKVFLELNLTEDCILSSAGNSAKFAIADTKLHVPIVTVSTKDKFCKFCKVWQICLLE